KALYHSPKMEEMRNNLPAIVSLIRSSVATQLVAPTGVGKSTLLPSVLSAIKKPDNINYIGVMVSVPTRTAARSLSANVSSNFPKLKVGYAAEGDIQYDDSTQLIYATGGHVRNFMYRHFSRGLVKSITRIGILIVDEVHAG